jgi:adenylylsulfate kinase
MSAGVVVWFTGLPSSGKSTLAEQVRARLRQSGHNPVLLDGDAVRASIVPVPGYDPRARADFYETLARLAALLAGEGHVVLVAATANRRVFRERARELAPRFVEVFVAADPKDCRARDSRGLYAAARAGTATGVPGADAAFEPPLAPEITARGGLDEAAAERVVYACTGGGAASLSENGG